MSSKLKVSQIIHPSQDTPSIELDPSGNVSIAGNLSGPGGAITPFAGFKNKLINGNFDIWQRGSSQTSSGYGSDDRWYNSNGGTNKTHSLQNFALGQTDVPGNPPYFSRTVVNSVAGAGNFCHKFQRIEDVRTLAGQTATLSFWAKADANKNIALEFLQSFGAGGTPSDRINGIGVTTLALTTSWQKYTVTVAIPSIAGKVLGTAGNACLNLV
ncbi:MAG: hypothetical protein IBX56_15300, partial [Methylomicrobium sp.]|nr:hypothetical protein [Methylomicrobium sp.]